MSDIIDGLGDNVTALALELLASQPRRIGLHLSITDRRMHGSLNAGQSVAATRVGAANVILF
jgi:hypothetical protein